MTTGELIDPTELRAFVARTCVATGCEPTEAELVATNLVEANLTGHDSHGVGMLPAYVDGVITGWLHPNRTVEVVQDSGPLLVVDGKMGFGQNTGHQTMQLAIERAREHGVALVGLRNSGHIGRIGHWGEQCAAAGLVSIHFVNVAGHLPVVAPYGGREGRFTTNPVCIAIPGSGDTPLTMLDMATSIIALGKARVALNTGTTVPEGSLLDGAGRVTTDPAGMFRDPTEGALVAFGDHKGSGLAVMCEILGAALTGGHTAAPHHPRPGSIVNSMLTIVVDPEATVGRAQLVEEAQAFIDYVVSSETRDGSSEVLAPGQPENRRRQERAAGIPVDATTRQELAAAAARVGITELGPIA